MTTQIKEYSQIEAGISALTEQYAIVPDCTTDAGLKLCKKSYREIRKFETEIEKKRKALGDEARKHLKAIGDEAKVIDEKLKVISAPFKASFEQRELEIKEAEQKRIAGIKQRIEQLSEFVMDAQSSTSDEVTSIIEAIDLIDCSEGFEEFTADALKAKQNALSKLGTLLQNKISSEGAERDRLAAEKLQQDMALKQKIEDRLNKLRMIPIDLMGKSAEDISSKLDSLNAYSVPAEDFGDRYQEAVDSKVQVIQQVSMMLKNQQLVEDAQAKADQEEARILNEKKAAQDEADRKAEQQRQQEDQQNNNTISEKPFAEMVSDGEFTVENCTEEPHFKMPTGRNQEEPEVELLRPAEVATLTPEEYYSLKYDSALLAALKEAGVESWEGYTQAINIVKAA